MILSSIFSLFVSKLLKLIIAVVVSNSSMGISIFFLWDFINWWIFAIVAVSDAEIEKVLKSPRLSAGAKYFP